MKKIKDISDRCDFVNMPPELSALIRADGRWTFRLQVWSDGEVVMNFTHLEKGIVTILGLVSGDKPEQTFTVLTQSMFETVAPRPTIAEGARTGTWSEFFLAMETARKAAIDAGGDPLAA